MAIEMPTINNLIIIMIITEKGVIETLQRISSEIFSQFSCSTVHGIRRYKVFAAFNSSEAVFLYGEAIPLCKRSAIDLNALYLVLSMR